jgi:hypothetical protein
MPYWATGLAAARRDADPRALHREKLRQRV